MKVLNNMVIVGVGTRRPSSKVTCGLVVANSFGWCKKLKLLIHIIIALSVLFSAGYSYAAVKTAGGATIHNAVTLHFNGTISQAFVDVRVKTIAVAPSIVVNTSAQATTAGAQVTYNYTITNKTNGSDTFSFIAVSINSVGISAPSMNMAATGTSSANLVLGASITSGINSVANTFVIPAGSEVDLVAGDIVVILNNLYQIKVGGIAPGTVQSLAGIEVPTVVTVTPVAASPTLGVGAVPAGIQVGEQKVLNLLLTAGAPSGSHTVNLKGSTLAKDPLTGNVVTYKTDVLAGNETVTTVTSTSVNFVKEARNVSLGGGYSQTSLQAQSTDIIEFRITVTEPTNLVAQVNGVLIDEVPALTTYVLGSTTLNGLPVVDGPLGTLPLSSSNGGLAVNSPGAGSGVITAGQSAVVTFRVRVN